MTSLSRPAPTLQIPQSPGFQGVPTGGILINRAEDERVLPRRSPTDPPSPVRIVAPASGITRGRPKSVSLPPANTPGAPADTPGQSSSPRIRFAPLPDPAVHGRTLSTSRPDQDHVSEVRNLGPGGADNDEAVDDDDDDDQDTDEDYSWDQDNGRRRSWAVTMGMGSWKSSSKKLLGGSTGSKSKTLSSSFGAPLTKSVSQPNSVNSSPFRWTGPEPKRAATAESGSSSGRRGSSVGAHRRGASGDSTFGTSPNPSVGARMLNGRVYGARRASEAALQEKINREKLEPAFIEWGPGGHGSTPSKPAETTGKGIDDDDGGGMAWVRRRREERERREREEKEAAERAAAAGESNGDSKDDVGPMGETLDAEQLGDQRPASLSSSASSVSSPRPAVGPLTPRDGPVEFALPAIHISEAPSKGPAGGIDIPRGRRQYSEDDDNDDDEDDGEDDEDEDFPADEEEEDDLPDIRRTCDAAGVEVLSRHK
ncbi:hypothetical protein Q8F55_008714 [Vanrija albida]|uniref:Uncharacterized protein n=1 Tax=Vanrija albida TaxID=181172 RepID=A0ABR3PRY7_9TREE